MPLERWQNGEDMRKAILTTVICVLLSGAFALGSYDSSTSVANGTMDPSLTIFHPNGEEAWYIGDADGVLRAANDTIQMINAAKTAIPPTVQLGLTASGQLLLSWAEISDVTAYKIYHAEAPEAINSGAWTVLATLPSGTLSYPVDPAQSRGFFYVTGLGLDLDMGTLTLVEGGTFHNGMSDVSLSSFYLDKYELTQVEYQAVMGTNPAHSAGVGDDYPVYEVSWFNALEYCNRRSIEEGLTPCYSYGGAGTDPGNWPGGWDSSGTNHLNISCNWAANGYRLPTEMEWMFAARGGNLTHDYTYSGSNDLDSVAWYNDNWGEFHYSTHTVGGKLANELGLFDMSGNVAEWVWDIYAWYPNGAQTNPTGPSEGYERIRRGGAWHLDSIYSEVSQRLGSDATAAFNGLGFRVARILP